MFKYRDRRFLHQILDFGYGFKMNGYIYIYEDGDLRLRLKGGLLPTIPCRFLLSDRMAKNNSAIESREV